MTPQTDALIAAEYPAAPEWVELAVTLETELGRAEAEIERWRTATRVIRDAAMESARVADKEHTALTADIARVTDQRDTALAGVARAHDERSEERILLEENLARVTLLACHDKYILAARAAEQRNAELVDTLADMTGYMRALRTDNTLERDGVIYALQTMEYAEGAAEYCDRAEALLAAHDEPRAESPTPAPHVSETDFGNITLPSAAIKGGAK